MRKMRLNSVRVAHTVLLELLRKARRAVGLEIRKGQEVNAAELCSELVFLVRVVHENLFCERVRELTL